MYRSMALVSKYGWTSTIPQPPFKLSSSFSLCLFLGLKIRASSFTPSLLLTVLLSLDITNKQTFLNTPADALTSYDLPSSSRRLLSQESTEVGGDGFPSWVANRQRKLLHNVVVAKDGSGKYKTISAALAKVPKKSNETFVIYIKAGVYVETMNVSKHMRNVFLIGDGPTKTKITESKSFVGSVNTYKTATVSADGEHFMVKDIEIENRTGSEMHQAVALCVSSDRVIIYNSQIDGYQDTLYAHTHRQFYRDCTISGTIEKKGIFFISMDVSAVCLLVSLMFLQHKPCLYNGKYATFWRYRRNHFSLQARYWEMLDHAETFARPYKEKACDDAELDAFPDVQTLRNFPKEELLGKVVLVRFDSRILLREELDQQSPSVSSALFTIKYLYDAGAKGLYQVKKAIKTNKKQFIAIIGGGKLLEKAAALHFLAARCDGLVFVGMMAFQIMHAQGLPVPKKLVERGAIKEALNLTQFAKFRSMPILFPKDFWCINDRLPKRIELFPAHNILDGWVPVDIGPKSLDEISSLLSECKKILWIGPVKFGLSSQDTSGATKLATMLDKLNRRNCDITVVGNMACQALTSVSTSVSSHNMVDNASVLWEILKGRKLPGLMALDRAYPFAIDWNATYTDPAHPLVVDIGSGNGLFLFRMARRRKDLNFLGLEINEKCPNPDFNKPEHRWSMLQRLLIEAIADLLASDGKVFLQSDIEAVAVRMKEQFVQYGKGKLAVMQDHGDANIGQGGWLKESPFGVWSDWEQHVIDRGAPIHVLGISTLEHLIVNFPVYILFGLLLSTNPRIMNLRCTFHILRCITGDLIPHFAIHIAAQFFRS
ncbi:hypothetical protein LOK49_LG10G01657, partial [Camellia lanceoleosa]